MNCPVCGTANEPERKFCGECGSPLAVACPNCGTPNAASDKFCGECGTDLRANAAQSAPAASVPVAERRLVSVLFADLVGFTALSEARDAEAVRDLLSRYFDTAGQIIGAYGGTVEKFIGDAVMAVWGAPTAFEDDAERAVRAALDLVEAVRGMGAEISADLQLRAAVLTGEAAVTLGATNQGMVAGDLVNTASRLQSVAPPGTVLVGDATMQAAAGAVAFEPAGEQLLKGKTAPVPAYRAIRVVARRGGIGRNEQLEAPFVGRGPELRMLKDFHVATGAEKRPRIVSIIGQGGIGKSRLVWEFLKYIDGVTEVVYWHQGRSPAYGEGISFWALAEMIRGRAGILESDDPAAARAKVGAMVAEWVTDESERRWIEPRLLQLLGLEAADAGDRPDHESLFAAWRVFFERLAEHGVVILVFEDLQWADDGQLDFIDHILEWSRDRPIYIITLARPELLDRRRDWGAGRRNFASLVLEPLTADEMRQLLAGLVPGLPDPVVERVLERAEGIPLYAVETVRMMLAEGLVVPEGGVFRPAGDLSELSVPASLHALIASRLDALDAGDRSLLQAAAVIGKTFSLEALGAVSGLNPDEIAARLRDLVRREMLSLEADPLSPEQGQYGFVQSLVREVAYGTLARGDRRRLHIAAARYFEAQDDEGIAGALAEHYVAAYKAQPEGPEGDAVAAQARVALRGAAERARSLGSFGQAVRFLELALEVTSDPVEQAQLHIAATDDLLNSGRVDEPIQHAERGLELMRAADDRDGVLQALTSYSQAISAQGRIEDEVQLLEPAREEYRDLVETEPYVRLCAELARAYLLTMRGDECITLVDATLPVAERLELTHEVLALLVTRGAVLAGMARITEAIATLTGAVESAKAYGFPDLELRGRVNLSYATAGEDPQLGYRVAREGVEMSQHLGMRGYAFYLLGNAAEFAIRMGDWEWADPQLEAAAQLETDLAAQMRLAEIRGLRGEDVAAEIDRVCRLTAEMTEAQAPAAALEVKAIVALARGDSAAALDLARQSAEMNIAPDSTSLLTAARAATWVGDRAAIERAMEAMDGLRGRSITAMRREAEAGLATLDGRKQDALRTYLESIRRWREIGFELEAAICALNLVTMLGTSTTEARAAADEAAATFERLGAAPLLTLLGRARAAEPPAKPGRAPSEAADQTEVTA
ncbi:MAG TPA: adenylate/guanylate cyclase domain-containing protein [Candidatus Limnocylindria bacterium]|nr:adenylate/guanylate cyclase domain-containing protein [Candidatus Limnocylindria bacterium]